MGISCISDMTKQFEDKNLLITCDNLFLSMSFDIWCKHSINRINFERDNFFIKRLFNVA